MFSTDFCLGVEIFLEKVRKALQSSFRGNTKNALKICIVFKNIGLLKELRLSVFRKISRLLKFLILRKAYTLGCKDNCFMRLLFESVWKPPFGPISEKNLRENVLMHSAK